MKTRCQTRKGGRPSTYFVLRSKAEHLYYTRHRRSTKYERFIKIFLKRDQNRRNRRFFCKKITTLFSSFFFSIYYVFTKEFHSLLCFHHSYCVGRIQTSFCSDQLFLLCKYPTMTVKMWKFLFQKPREHSLVL